MLEGKGLLTVEDLLAYAPFRYEDRTNVKSIAQLAPGEMATVIAEVRTRAAGRASGGATWGMFEASFTDSSRAILGWPNGSTPATWPSVIAAGQKIALYGKVEFDSYSGELTHAASGVRDPAARRRRARPACTWAAWCPIYEAAGKITTRIFRQLRASRARVAGAAAGPAAGDRSGERLKLPERWTAIRETALPAAQDADLRLLNAFRSPAQFRLIFEEFFWLECGLALKHKQARMRAGHRLRAQRPGAGADQADAAVQAHRRRRSGCWGRSRATWQIAARP